MIALDYVKLHLKNIDFNQLEFDSNLNFTLELGTNTGELFTKKRVALYHHCTIKIIQGKEEKFVEFTGSLHKMWNSIRGIPTPNLAPRSKDRGFNGNSFTYSEFCKARIHLELLFSCKSENMIIKNIEFGANVHLPFNTSQFLKGLLYHKGRAFESRYRETFHKAIHSYYYLKLYDKAAQYKMNEQNILRVEISIKRTEEMRRCKLGIVSLSDINISSLNNALKMLVNRFNEVVYYDISIKEEYLSKAEKRNLLNYKNPRYWIELKTNHHDRPKKHLKGIIEMHSDNIGKQISNALMLCYPKIDNV